MIDILTRAGCFVAIILLGVILRRVGFFKREDFNLLSKIVIRITLPAAIITNLAGREFEYSLFILVAIGLIYGIVLMSAASRSSTCPASTSAISCFPLRTDSSGRKACWP